MTRLRDMPKSVGIDSVIIFSNLPNFFFILTFKYFLFCILEKDMKRKPSDGETNSQLKLNFLKILVYTLTIIMIVGMIIIVIVIIKEFFYKPKENYDKLILPRSIKIPYNSKLETINLDNENIIIVLTLADGKQQIILINIKDGIEKSRKYIEINNQR